MSSRRNFIKTTGLITAGSLFTPAEALAKLPYSSKTKIKPTALKAGDTVAITSPAGAVWDENQIDIFVAILKGMGFTVVLGKTLKEKFGLVG